MRISDWSSDVCSSDLLDIGMIGGLAQHPRDDATLFGHSQALLVAKGFDIDHMSHERNLGTVADKSKPPPHISSAARQARFVAAAISAAKCALYPGQFSWRACGAAPHNWERPSDRDRKRGG